MFFLPVVTIMVCVTDVWIPPQYVRTGLPFAGFFFRLQTQRSRAKSCEEGSEGVNVCVGVSDRQHHVLYGCVLAKCRRTTSSSASVLWLLVLCWPITQIKLLQFSPSLPSTSLCCPLPGTFVFTWPTSQGTYSYLWLSGLAAKCAVPVKFFHSDLLQYPNWTVKSFPVIPP